MSEILVLERNYKKGGGWKMNVDREKKFIRAFVLGGISDDTEVKEYQELVRSEVIKFNKGEVLFLSDVTKLDLRFLSNESAKTSKVFAEFISSYCKKGAVVSASFVFTKSAEGRINTSYQYFDNVQDAEQWLFKD